MLKSKFAFWIIIILFFIVLVNPSFILGTIVKKRNLVELVTLSSFLSYPGKVFNSYGQDRLISSFFIAGANSVSVSLWQNKDDLSATFMKYFYKLTLEGKSDYSEALTFLKRRFIKGDFGIKATLPYYWAPFVYYGK